jgi:hypothetical protein
VYTIQRPYCRKSYGVLKVQCVTLQKGWQVPCPCESTVLFSTHSKIETVV